MSRYKIKKPCLDARVVRVRQWHEELSGLDELIRPVVLRINEARGLVTIRPKTAAEITEIKKRRGLPMTDRELVMTSGCLVTNPAKLNVVQEKA